MQRSTLSPKTLRLAQVSILAALVVVMQLLSYVIPIRPFNLALVLIPIVVGAGLLGAGAGAGLGALFGVVVLLASIFGLDAGGAMMWAFNPAMTALVCVLKGAMAGLIPGLIIGAFRKTKQPAAGVWVGALTAPLINTGIFLAGALLVFKDVLLIWAGDKPLTNYILFTLLGVNFLIEFALNAVFAPVILRIIQAVKQQKRSA